MGNDCMSGKLLTICEKAEHDLEKLQEHIEAFDLAFSEDTECWQGEAATEERCFISSDRDELKALIKGMKTLIGEVKIG